MLPLDGASEADPERGGYGYLDWSDYQRGWHEGRDLNCGVGIDGDLGAPLLALCRMRLAYNGSSARGFGNHQWWEIIEAGPYQGAFVHYAHADSFTCETVGTELPRGATIGACGKSGGQYAAHLHVVVTRAQPTSWSWYGGPTLTKEEVAALTHDPRDWWNWCDAHPDGEETMTDEERAVLTALRETSYPPSEAAELIRAAHTWSANAQSLAGWIEKIGALEARNADLERQLSEAATSADQSASS